MLSPFWLKLIGGVAAVLMLVVLVKDRNHWKAKAQSYNAEAAAMYDATRDASGNRKLERRDTVKQINAMGVAIIDLKVAIAEQNAAVKAMADESARQQREAAQAAQEARQRANGSQRVSDSLIASSRSSERQARPCEPSEVLKEAWR